MPSPEEMLQSILSDSDAMEKISEMLSAFSSEEGSEDNHEEKGSSTLFDDPAFIFKIGEILGSLNGEDDNNTKLLTALKPYLSEKRAESADKAIKLMKLTKLSSLLGDMNLF